MDEPMISREAIRAKARDAFARGAGRDDHGLDATFEGAIAEWQDEWGRQYEEWAKDSRVCGNQELEAA